MTMTDRELLDRAATAAGADWVVEEDGRFEVLSEIGGFSGYWNPLTDDGDALRLAVKLGLGLNHAGNRSWSWLCKGPNDGAKEEIHNGDPYTATRRAIVRAAAAMAKED